MIYLIAAVFLIWAIPIGILAYRIRKEDAQIDAILAPESESSQHITKIHQRNRVTIIGEFRARPTGEMK